MLKKIAYLSNFVNYNKLTNIVILKINYFKYNYIEHVRIL